MGLLDEIKKGVSELTGSSPAAATGGQSGSTALTHSVLDMLSGQGLANLVQSMKEKGLSEVVSSWIGTGQNLPISAAQIQSALGSEKITQLSQKAGISQEDAATNLSKLLPEVVDKLTPNGSVDSGLLQQGISMLKSKLTQSSSEAFPAAKK
jgi:uncharacterized protein YidB (DUF937 family)